MTSRAARIGIVVLQSEYSVETLDLPDPFDTTACRCVPACWPWHADFWPVPSAVAVAAGVRVPEIMEGSPTVLASVAAAVDRLAPHCDLIVGGRG